MELESFEQNREEIPQTYEGYKALLGTLKEKIDSPSFDELPSNEKLESLERTEKELEDIDANLGTLFVNPQDGNEYSNLKEMIEDTKEVIYKWHRQLERPN